MKIFILEDNPHRMIKFRRNLIGHDIDHTDTVRASNRLLILYKYDLIFLDHDLGGREMVNSLEEETGYQVAVFMASFGKNQETPCIVHSCNPAGANNIIRALPHAIQIPFPSLDITGIAHFISLSKNRTEQCR